jgi:ferredoxin
MLCAAAHNRAVIHITASVVMEFVHWIWRKGPAARGPEYVGEAKQEWEIAIMAYVITDTCTKDELCVEACPTDCIHPKKDEDGFEAAPQLYVDPDGCIDCGACVPVCPTNSVFVAEEVPADKQEFIAKNAEHYA